MAESKLSDTNLTFTNSESNTGAFSFNTSEEFEVNRPLQCAQGIVSSSLTIGASGSFSASTNYDNLTVGDLKIKDDSGELITVTAPSAVTAHTLTLPSAQGTANHVLTNNGSGTLSWSHPKGTWSQFGSTVSSGFTESGSGASLISKYDIDITNFKDGTDKEMLVEIRTSVHATTFMLQQDLLSIMDHGNNGGWKYCNSTFDTRYVMYKIYDSQTNLEIEAGGYTLSHIRMYTR